MRLGALSKLLPSALVVCAASLSLAVGPTSTLYAVESNRWGPDGYPGYPSGLDVIQGGVLSSSSDNALSLNELAIAVAGDVRLMGAHEGDAGSLFDLNGSLQDHHAFVTPPGFGVSRSAFLDSTSDGFYNYGVDGQTGSVIRMNRDWTNPVSLFSVGGSGYTGISMNVADGSFWVSRGNLVAHYSQGGSLLSEFNGAFSYAVGLAYDPADGTLWMQGSSFFRLAQYDQAGHLLQDVAYDVQSWDQNGFFGMEFNQPQATPEPTTVTVFAIGSAALLRRRKKAAQN